MIIIQSPVKFSSRAVEEIRKIKESKNIPPDYGLRLGTRDAGTPAVSYLLGFDVKNHDDNEYSTEGITLFIQKKEISHLAGMTLDYYEGPETRGFTFLKPGN
jgi:iron-sulfur cluster assembly protein